MKNRKSIESGKSPEKRQLSRLNEVKRGITEKIIHNLVQKYNTKKTVFSR